MERTRIFLSSTRFGVVPEALLSPGSRPSTVWSAKTRFAGATGICDSTAFPCGPETPWGDAGRRSLKAIQQAITSTATTPTAASHRALYHGTRFARFEAALAVCVTASNFPARAMKGSQAWYIARFVVAEAATDARLLRASSP